MAWTCSKQEFAVLAPFFRPSQEPCLCAAAGGYGGYSGTGTRQLSLVGPGTPSSTWFSMENLSGAQGMGLWAWLSAAPGFLPAAPGIPWRPQPWGHAQATLLSLCWMYCTASWQHWALGWDVAMLVRLAKTHRETLLCSLDCVVWIVAWSSSAAEILFCIGWKKIRQQLGHRLLVKGISCFPSR